MTDSTPRTVRVAVIATVLNEEGSVGALIDSLLAQTRRPDEIVIVDGGSRDGTVAALCGYVERGAPLRVIVAPGANISAGRNRAISESTAEIVASVDAGVRIEPGWLAALVRPFEAPGGETVDVVGGFFRSDPRSAFELALGATTLPDVAEIDPATFLPSSRSVAFRRAAWAKVSGYPEWLDYCEDLVFDFALKDAGCRFAFAPDALVHFRPRPTPLAFYKQYYRYARGDGKANLWLKRHIVRYLTYALGPLVLALGFWYKPSWLALVVAGGAYLYRPYRHLAASLGGRPTAESLVAIGWVPIIRLIGDVAKMVGYPVGVAWRLRRQRPAPPVDPLIARE